MQLTDVSVNKLALLLPNKSCLYRFLVRDLGYYLPKESSKAIREAYLLGVLRGEFYSLKNNEKKELMLKEDLSAGKSELIDELIQKVPKSMGFSLETAPNRDWLLDVLNTLDPNNRLLKGDPALDFTRKVPEG